MAKQIIGYGTKVERSANGQAWTEIVGVKTVSVPFPAPDYVETTHLQSAGRSKEYIKALSDNGEISLTAAYSAATVKQQNTDAASDDAIYYRITLPLQSGQTGGDKFTFRGFPSIAALDLQTEAPTDMTVNIKVTGPTTYAEGATS